MKEELVERFQKIINSKNAFQTPQFRIKKSLENKILMYAPLSFNGNLMNASSYSYPWNEKGSSAKYNIHSDHDLNVKPIIKKNGDTEKIKYSIRVNNEVAQSIVVSKNEIEFSNIKIVKGENIIEVLVKDSESENEIHFTELILK